MLSSAQSSIDGWSITSLDGILSQKLCTLYKPQAAIAAINGQLLKLQRAAAAPSSKAPAIPANTTLRQKTQMAVLTHILHADIIGRLAPLLSTVITPLIYAFPSAA